MCAGRLRRARADGVAWRSRMGADTTTTARAVKKKHDGCVLVEADCLEGGDEAEAEGVQHQDAAGREEGLVLLGRRKGDADLAHHDGDGLRRILPREALATA